MKYFYSFHLQGPRPAEDEFPNTGSLLLNEQGYYTEPTYGLEFILS